MSNLLATILVTSDRHKKDTDFSTIKNSCLASSLVTDDLIKIIKELHVTHLFSLGDWYHRGYHKQDAQYVDTYDDMLLSRLVNGNFYEVGGNHLLLERDANPEFYLIQPNSYEDLKPTSNRKFREPVIRLVDSLIIGPAQFSFFHYNKTNKNYVRDRKPGIKYHIGLYHDDTIVPNSVRKECGLITDTNSEYLAKVYNNIDVAFIGHIHTKIGKVKLQLNTGKTIPVIIPGAMCLTSSKPTEFHKTVDLPVIKVYDDRVTLSYKELSLHTDVMTIYREEAKIPTENKEMYKAKETKPAKFKVPETFREEAETCSDFNEYLARLGLGAEYEGLYKLAIRDQLTETEVDNVLQGEVV